MFEFNLHLLIVRNHKIGQFIFNLDLINREIQLLKLNKDLIYITILYLQFITNILHFNQLNYRLLSFNLKLFINVNWLYMLKIDILRHLNANEHKFHFTI